MNLAHSAVPLPPPPRRPTPYASQAYPPQPVVQPPPPGFAYPYQLQPPLPSNQFSSMYGARAPGPGTRGRGGRGGCGGYCRGQPQAHGMPQQYGTQTAQNPPSIIKRFANWNYCSTHGFDVGDNHRSDNCQRPGYSHNWHATRDNTMGGSNRNKSKTQFPTQQPGQYPALAAPPGPQYQYGGRGY